MIILIPVGAVRLIHLIFYTFFQQQLVRGNFKDANLLHLFFSPDEYIFGPIVF
jgi:hypothetical protein